MEGKQNNVNTLKQGLLGQVLGGQTAGAFVGIQVPLKKIAVNK